MQNGLTLEQEACNAHTLEHILRVNEILTGFVAKLLARGISHDRSKLSSPEVELFTEVTPKLKGLTYGSPEYIENCRLLGPALTHHYANNRHHPQHFPNGIRDMTLLDLIEMFADWKAASERHDNGNIRMSIEANATRFNMGEVLRLVFENTIAELD